MLNRCTRKRVPEVRILSPPPASQPYFHPICLKAPQMGRADLCAPSAEALSARIGMRSDSPSAKSTRSSRPAPERSVGIWRCAHCGASDSLVEKSVRRGTMFVHLRVGMGCALTSRTVRGRGFVCPHLHAAAAARFGSFGADSKFNLISRVYRARTVWHESRIGWWGVCAFAVPS